MSSDVLIVPVITVSSHLHFAEVGHDATAQDVIDDLSKREEVKLDVLGDLEDAGWALQRIRVERNGRTWEEEELETLGDGMARSILHEPVFLKNSMQESLNLQQSWLHC